MLKFTIYNFLAQSSGKWKFYKLPVPIYLTRLNVSQPNSVKNISVHLFSEWFAMKISRQIRTLIRKKF